LVFHTKKRIKIENKLLRVIFPPKREKSLQVGENCVKKKLISCIFTKYYDGHIKEDEVDGKYSTYKRNACKIMAGKPEQQNHLTIIWRRWGKSSLGSSRCRWGIILYLVSKNQGGGL
jgi:hypothetical protein